MIEAIQTLVARIGKMPAPPPDADVFQAGLASVDALELLVELEDTFQITIPDDRFIATRTIAGFAALVQELQGAGAP